MAVGLLSAARESGLQVPTQLAVAGCENILMTSQTTPGVTVIDYPRKKAAATAIEMMLEYMKKDSPCSRTLPAELLVRASTESGC
jgi:DNA-binding LacI/PurR family transcriptional regulator